ncbi:hypothetical protein [Mycolicibacterium celeriflavum]|uniref:hypothetical protein n=1 Tax=Mycolicibacterium celeriflavum TaxID=1249101 RepID=UPI003CEC5C8C
MKIASPDTDQYWYQISAHTSARNGRNGVSGAPWPLQLHVAALVGNEGIEASATTFSGDAPSTWSIAIVTADARLVMVRMQFDAEQYDLERDRETPEDEAAEITVSESWVRRLRDVVRLDVGKVRMRRGSFGRMMSDQLDVGKLSLTFRDGTVSDLEFDQVAMTTHDDRAQSDQFMDALRKHTGL